MSDQLPAVLPPGAIATAVSTDTHIIPAFVATLGDRASSRCIEFFAASIHNPNTRRACARACNRFFGWCVAMVGCSNTLSRWPRMKPRARR
jgi:hypothetical protein